MVPLALQDMAHKKKTLHIRLYLKNRKNGAGILGWGANTYDEGKKLLNN